jgi:hypothetical protein
MRQFGKFHDFINPLIASRNFQHAVGDTHGNIDPLHDGEIP